MNEIDRLKMQVEHYENKEKNLIKWLNDVIEMVEYKEKILMLMMLECIGIFIKEHY